MTCPNCNNPLLVYDVKTRTQYCPLCYYEDKCNHDRQAKIDDFNGGRSWK